jgi:hypothetical protein
MRAVMVIVVLAVLAFAGAAAAQSSSSQDEQILKQGTPSGGTEAAPPAVEDEEISSTYSSIGVQQVHAKFDNVKDAINIDMVAFGFRIPTVPWVGVELNLGFTFAPGQIDTSSTTGGGGGGALCGLPGQPACPPPGNTASSSTDFTATDIGASLVLRSPGTFFVVGKYGYRYLNTSLTELQNDRSGSQYAAGVGYRWNKKGSYAEFGYTKIADKIDALGFSLSYSYGRH